MDTPIPALTRDALPPLAVKESSKGFLVPAAARYNLTVTIDFSWLPEDFITITVAGTSGNGSYTSPRIPIGGFKRPFTTHIDNILVAFNLGLTVIAFYTLYRGTEPSVESQPLPLYIPLINQLDLPLPVIKEASDEGEGRDLDVSELTEVTLRIRSWLLSRREQFFWLLLTGVKPDGDVWEAWYWQAPENFVGNGFSLGYYEQKVPAAPLQGLKNGSVLTLSFWAGLQNSPDQSDAQAFAHRNYIVRTAPVRAPRIMSVTGPQGLIADGGETPSSRVTVDGVGTDGAEVVLFDGQTRLDSVLVNAGTWQFSVTALTDGEHVFRAEYVDGGASNTWTIKVVFSQELRIKEAPDNVTLNPADAEVSLTAVLNVPDDADFVSATWAAEPDTPSAGSRTTALVPVSAMLMEMPLPVALVAYSMNKTAAISFTHVRGTSAPVTSTPWPLKVLPIPEALRIPPVIAEAKGTELDLKDVVAGATVQFLTWLGIATGQRLELKLTGFNASGTEHNLSIWTDSRNAVHRAWVTAGRYSTLIRSDYMLALGPGSTLSVLFAVYMDQVPGSVARIDFNAREYTIKDTR
jgi:hypothetical protein